MLLASVPATATPARLNRGHQAMHSAEIRRSAPSRNEPSWRSRPRPPKSLKSGNQPTIARPATSVIDNDVSILQNVTLGGTGNETGDRHPKVRRGAMIGAGAKILGNIEIGMCSLIAAGSVVLHPVPPNTTIAGVPARAVGTAGCAEPSRSMNQILSQLAYESFTYTI
jgi:hypothetical protein